MIRSEYSIQDRVRSFMVSVFGWMAVGLSVTAGLAYAIASNPIWYNALAKYQIFLIFAQFGLVLALSFLINRINFITALGLFLVYSASVGITLSVLFMVYTKASLYSTFAITAGMFGAMCIYGYTTRADLTNVGSMSMMALFGLIIASIVNIFLKSSMMHLIISGVGVLVFTLLTAWDAQRIKQMGYNMLEADQDTAAKASVFGALSLYLDFLNLFLFILSFLGQGQRK